jgi:hypothetical protein
MNINFIKNFCGKYWKANSEKTNATDEHAKSNNEIVKNLLSYIMSDEYLSVPIYLQGMSCEEQAQAFGTLYPLQYAWNEHQTDDGLLEFSFSINGAVVGSMLEQIIPRENTNFTAIRDEIINTTSDAGRKSLVNMAEKYLLPPSQLLKNFAYDDMVNVNYYPM